MGVCARALDILNFRMHVALEILKLGSWNTYASLASEILTFSKHWGLRSPASGIWADRTNLGPWVQVGADSCDKDPQEADHLDPTSLNSSCLGFKL